MKICMTQLLRLAITLSVALGVNSSSVFRFGAVLSTEGELRVMLDAKRGYQLFFDMANEHSRSGDFLLLGAPDTERHRFEYEFIWREDNSDPDIHAEEVENLIKKDSVHFLGGSHHSFAEAQMEQSDKEDILDFYCCVGPDSLYERDFKRVFGIHVSNKEYTRMTIQRLSLEGVKRLWIVSDESNLFTKTTCDAAFDIAMDFADSSNCLSKMEYKRFNGSDSDPLFLANIAHTAKEEMVEAIVGCLSHGSGEELVNALHNVEYSLKAFFITGGPTSQDWVNEFEPVNRSESLLSAAQWHKEMTYKDEFFGNSTNYVRFHRKKFNGLEPTYVSASASATGLTLHHAIQRAFQNCDISYTNGNVDQLLYNASAIMCQGRRSNKTGYKRVLEALETTEMQIFFGNIKFNMFRRNEGMTPVTTQVLPTESESSREPEMEIKAVLPLTFATSLFRYPAENHYKDYCEPGYYVGLDPFDRCKKCGKGSVSFNSNAADCDSCPMGTYMDKPGQSECQNCPEGTNTAQRGSTSLSDCSCLRHFYNPTSQRGVECYPCPEGAVCNGGIDQPYPQWGYWMNLTNRVYAYSCDPADLCVGGPHLECRKENMGRLCQQCNEGYFQIVDHCYRCPNGTLIVFIIIGLLVGWYVINVIVSRSVASLELLLGWAQLANIIGDVDLNWTLMLRRLFGFANVLDFDVDILEPSCLIEKWGFKQNLVVQLCLPFVMSMMAGIGFLSSVLMFHLVDNKVVRVQDRCVRVLSWFIAVPESKEELGKKWDLTLATFLASVDITYVTIVKYCFDAFSCETIAGVSVLKVDPEVVCNNRAHNVLIALASIGIVFYVLGYLVCVSWIILHFRKKKSFCQEVNIRRFGFIYQKFELEYYYTPIIIILRKLLFVLVLVYLEDPAFQIGALAIIINASLMIHVFTAPYVDTYIDVLFSFLLVALMFESFGGLMFYSDNLPQKNRTILEWIVMATFFLLVFVFVIIFGMEVANKYHIHQIKKRHRDHAMKRTISGGTWSDRITSAAGGILKTAVSLATGGCKKKEAEVSFELVDTFKPSFVNQCMKKDENFIKEWDELTNMLEVYMSDQSPTSYLSVEQNAKFWRKMVDRFPEIVDYLAVVDDKTREQFRNFVNNLFKDFYLTNKVVSLPLMKVLNWRDRAPMAHWLTTASNNDREFFLKTLSRMFRSSGQETTANILDAKTAHGGSDPDLESRLQNAKINGKQRTTLSRITSGSSPLDHPALDMAKTATVALSIQKFKQTSKRVRRTQQVTEKAVPLEVLPSTSAVIAASKDEPLQGELLEISPVDPVSDNPAILPNNKDTVKCGPALDKCVSSNSDFKNNKSVSFQP